MTATSPTATSSDEEIIAEARATGRQMAAEVALRLLAGVEDGDDTTTHIAVAIDTDSEQGWPERCEPGDYTDDPHWVEADVPATLMALYETAMSLHRSTLGKVLDTAGVDVELGGLATPCPEWTGTTVPTREWVRIKLTVPGGEHAYFGGGGLQTEDEARAVIDGYPEEFFVVMSTRLVRARGDAFTVETGSYGGYHHSCTRCGRAHDDHATATQAGGDD
ncbi:MAG: hypothetical protein JWM89_1830 [Acidimicrobiales bacterium]|nr:hypothetical protein [Acidimicrobiales bacterium]